MAPWINLIGFVVRAVRGRGGLYVYGLRHCCMRVIVAAQQAKNTHTYTPAFVWFLSQASPKHARTERNGKSLSFVLFIYLFVRLSSLPAVLSETASWRELLGLGPRSSRLDVLGGAVIDLVLFKVGSLARHVHVVGILRMAAVGKDGVVGSSVARVHRKPSFLGGAVGVNQQLDVLGRSDHSRQGSVEIVEVGLGGAVASTIVGSSSAAHGR